MLWAIHDSECGALLAPGLGVKIGLWPCFDGRLPSARAPASACHVKSMAISGYLVAGTYERTLCGYTLDGEGSFTSIFNQPAHLGPVKAVASAGRFLVSGGSDEEIRYVIFSFMSKGTERF